MLSLELDSKSIILSLRNKFIKTSNTKTYKKIKFRYYEYGILHSMQKYMLSV
jgi:hypothetical protein